MAADQGRSASTDLLLASYATGSLSSPLHALVGAHLVLNPGKRGFVAALEGIAADGLNAEEPLAPVAERGKRLAAIFKEDLRLPVAEAGDPLLPSPLAAYVGVPFDALGWRTVLPGLREVRFDNGEGTDASLLWIKAGRAMPAHTHHGIEATLVLKGSFSDSTGHYARGDLSVADDDVDHKPVAGLEEDCICFAVCEGPVKLTGPVARLFNKLLRH